MPIYKPRAYARMTVPIAGTAAQKTAMNATDDVVTVDFIPMRVTIISNDHNHADECHLTAPWKAAGVDPRFLADATVEVWLQHVDRGDGDVDLTREPQFIGIMTRPRRVGGEGQGMLIDLEFYDYTTLFLESKDFPNDGVPDYDQTLDDAWRRICDHTGRVNPDTGELDTTVRALRDRLELVGLDFFPVLGKAVAKRIAKLGKFPVKPSSNAWEVWQQVVGSMGLISFIRKDKCIVTTATDYYTSNNPPRFIWGKNVAKMSEQRDTKLAGTGIGITSFDPLTGTTLEALWPPVGDAALHRKRLSAKVGGDFDEVRRAESRHYYEYYGVTDPAVLLAIAKRAYEERSRQDVEGTILTYEMTVEDSVRGEEFDLLELASGDVVRIEFSPEDTEVLGQLTSDDQRISYLMGRGYSEGSARVLVANMKGFANLEPTFFVKAVRTTLDAMSGEGGTYETEISYLNRIHISGAATPR